MTCLLAHAWSVLQRCLMVFVAASMSNSFTTLPVVSIAPALPTLLILTSKSINLAISWSILAHLGV